MKNINFTTSGSLTSTLLFNNQISPDVYSFFAEAGQEIRLETSNASEGLDTTIRVVGPNAETSLFDDDGAGFPLSRLVFTAEDTGTYIAVVSSFGGNPGGGNYTLDFARSAAGQGVAREVSEDADRGKSMPELENQVDAKAGT